MDGVQTSTEFHVTVTETVEVEETEELNPRPEAITIVPIVPDVGLTERLGVTVNAAFAVWPAPSMPVKVYVPAPVAGIV